jgi:hypothetical protein
MLNKLLIILTILISNVSISIGQSTDSVNKLSLCREDWQYLNLTKQLEGKIIFFQQPDFGCGTLSNASNAIILTDKGDTIRVLTSCDVKPIHSSPRFILNDYVVVATTSFDFAKYRIDFIPSDPFSCVLKVAYFGEIKKKVMIN